MLPLTRSFYLQTHSIRLLTCRDTLHWRCKVHDIQPAAQAFRQTRLQEINGEAFTLGTYIGTHHGRTQVDDQSPRPICSSSKIHVFQRSRPILRRRWCQCTPTGRASWLYRRRLLHRIQKHQNRVSAHFRAVGGGSFQVQHKTCSPRGFNDIRSIQISLLNIHQ